MYIQVKRDKLHKYIFVVGDFPA